MKLLKTPLIFLFVWLLSLVFVYGQTPPDQRKLELIVQTGHSSIVYTVAYSPDGKTIATASRDMRIKLWDAATGSELRSLVVENASEIDSIMFGPDGKTLASVSTEEESYDKIIKLWDAATGTVFRTFTGGATTVGLVVFSPDGKTLAGAIGDNFIKLWDIASGTEIKTFSGGSFAFSPDGKTLTIVNEDGMINVWDIASGNALKTLDLSDENPYPAAFSPDGKTLAWQISDGDQGKIKLFDLASGTDLQILSLPSQNFTADSIEFSPDGKTLAVNSGYYRAGQAHELTFWDIASGTELKNIELPDSYGSGIAFSPDGKMLVSSIGENIAKIFDVASAKELRTLKAHSENVLSLAFHPDGKTLAGGSDNKTIKLWNGASGRELRTLREFYWKYWNTGSNPEYITSVAFSPDGKYLIGGNGMDIEYGIGGRWWDVESGKQLRPSKTSDEISPDGKIWVTSDETLIYVFDVASRQQLRTLKGHTAEIESYAFSPDGKTLVSFSRDKTIKLWDIASGTELKTVTGTTYAFGPDGRILVTGNSETITLWNVDTGAEIKTISDNSSNIISIVFSPDGKTLAVGSGEQPSEDPSDEIKEQGEENPGANSIRFWDVETGKGLGIINGYTGGDFSFDGKTFLAGGGDNGPIKLWDVESGIALRTPGGDLSENIRSVLFSPDGKILAVGNDNGTLSLWEVEREDGSFSNPQIIDNLVFVEYIERLETEGISAVSDNLLAEVKDQTKIKLSDKETGRELATLIAIDDEDWLVTTPDGLFDGSPNAWKTMLWRFDGNTFNNAPVEAFFKEFYRPGLLQDVFAGNPIPPPTQDISTIDIRQPSLTISAIDEKPTDSPVESLKKTVRVKVEITDNTDKGRQVSFPASSDARDVRVFRNGSLVRKWDKNTFELTEKDGCRQLAATGETPRKAVCETDVQITAGRNELTAYGFNHDNVKSNDATAVVNGSDILKREGTLYVLAVGVNEYSAEKDLAEKDKKFKLRFAVNDVETISREINEQQAGLTDKQYARTEVITLTDENATKANILTALQRFAVGEEEPVPTDRPENVRLQLGGIKQTQPEDALIIYFAGHGLADKDRFYLIPHDGIPNELAGQTEQGERQLVQKTSTDLQEQLFARSISDLEVEEILSTVDVGKMLMVIDACNSGQALESEEKRRGPMNSRGLAQLAYEKGMYILTASQSRQAALEATKLNHGLLTYALLQGLKNADQNGDQSIVDREWLDFAVTQVPQLQLEIMRQRSDENKRQLTQKKPEISIIQDDQNLPPDQRGLQTPRVFYRRELENNPLVLAKPQ